MLALLVLGGLSVKAGSGYTDSFSLPGTESTTALNLLTENFNTESTDTNQVVFAAEDVTDPATQARIERTLDRIADAPARRAGRQPVRRGRRAEPDLQERQGRVRDRAHGRRAADRRRPQIRLRRADRRRRGRARRRTPGGAGRQRDPAGHAAAGRRPERADRLRRRRDRARARLRLPVGHAAAADLRGPGARLRPRPDRPARARDRHRHLLPDARHPDRPGRRHRLRAVRRHPPPQRDQGRPRARGRVRALAEHLRPGGAVRRRHGDRGAAGPVRARRELPQRGRGRLRDRGPDHDDRGRHADPRAAGRDRHAGAVAQGTPAARRAGPQRPQAGRVLAEVGAVRAGAPRRAGRGRADRDARARRAGAVAAPGLLRRRAGPGVQHHPQGVRPARAGVRAGLQRHVADRR